MSETKWDHLTDSQKEGYESTPCGLHCSGCDIYLDSEADFAKHFIIKDVRFLNLGECPNKLVDTYRKAYVNA